MSMVLYIKQLLDMDLRQRRGFWPLAGIIIIIIIVGRNPEVYDIVLYVIEVEVHARTHHMARTFEALTVKLL